MHIHLVCIWYKHVCIWYNLSCIVYVLCMYHVCIDKVKHTNTSDCIVYVSPKNTCIYMHIHFVCIWYKHVCIWYKLSCSVYVLCMYHVCINTVIHTNTSDCIVYVLPKNTYIIQTNGFTDGQTLEWGPSTWALNKPLDTGLHQYLGVVDHSFIPTQQNSEGRAWHAPDLLLLSSGDENGVRPPGRLWALP